MLKIINERYTIDEYGNVYDCKKQRYLKHFNNGFGYEYVLMVKNGKYKQYKVHRLVAEAYIPNPENKPFVNHKDCNRSNNCFANLEWCTQKENINYSQKINSSYNDRNKGVQQFDKNNKLLATYKSISDASRITGIKVSSISYSANGQRKTGGGYIWRFV